MGGKSIKDVQRQQQRKLTFQEHVNRRVLLEWVRITGLEHKHNWKYDRLLSNLANVITGYSNDGQQSAFTWPTAAGMSGGIEAIRAKVSYDYWRYFMKDGRKKLSEYNKKNSTKIAILKEMTLKNMDENNLGLLLRKKIGRMYMEEGKKIPDMSVKRGKLCIGKSIMLKPSIAVIRLNLEIPDWKGLPISELLTDKDKKEIEEGVIKRGDLVLPGFGNPDVIGTSYDAEKEQGSASSSIHVNGTRKRLLSEEENQEIPLKRISKEDLGVKVVVD